MHKLAISQINMSGGTQPRAAIDYAVIGDYADDMTDGADFPPVVVFYDGADYWLADGFHRVHAACKCGWLEIDAEVRQGTRRDAQWYSFGANKTHGKRREPGDKRRAIESILRDSEWGLTPQSDIADHVGVTPSYVSQVKSSINDLIDRPSERTVTRGDSTYTMQTAGIGKRESASEAHAEPEAPVSRETAPSKPQASQRESVDRISDTGQTPEFTFISQTMARIYQFARCPIDDAIANAVREALTEALRERRIVLP